MIDARPDELLKSSPWAQFAIVGALFFGVQRFFKEVEDKLSVSGKAAITRWLITGGSSEAWAASFIGLFDAVFGKRHLSWKCFSRSALITMAVTVGIGILYGFNHLGYGTVLIYSALNIIPDYCSLLVTRAVLRWLSRYRSWLACVLFLACDFVGSAIIGYIGWSYGMIWTLLLVGAPRSFKDFTPKEYLLPSLPIDWRVANLAAILKLILPSLLTSVWLWVYVLAGLFLRMTIAYRALDVENKPLQALGLVSGVLSSTAYLLLVVSSIATR